MKVTHQSDHITHVVIGGKAPISFGISDDPAFFQVLSSALYKDPMLAMVRETMCNAWDAHIEKGITDPIEITLHDGYLTIKDFGHGIHDDLIGPIYGIYGASTKKQDGRVTGGFGLGCKSPFAYTDHFQVISCHQGKKTIYNMNKSSAEREGKPSIVAITTVPTTETGITVRIPLNETRANSRLDQLIREVAFKGDIPTQFDGTILPMIGLDKSDYGMVLIKEDSEINVFTDDQSIYVRYGNVVYPVNKPNQVSNVYNRISNLLKNRYKAILVIQAPPDSISVTPSREALTNSDLTVKTVDELLIKFLSVFLKNQVLAKTSKDLAKAMIKTAADNCSVLRQDFTCDEWEIPGIASLNTKQLLATHNDFAEQEVFFMLTNDDHKLRGRDWLKHYSQYMFYLLEKDFFDRGLFHSWYGTAKKHVKKLREPGREHHSMRETKDHKIATKWWQRRVMMPIVETLQGYSKFSPRNLYYTGVNTQIKIWNAPIFTPVARTTINSHTCNLICLFKPIVFVNHNNKKLRDRLSKAKHNNETTSYGDSFKYDTYFAYEVSQKNGEAEEVLKILRQNSNIEVIDVTGKFDYEREAYEAKMASIVRRKALIDAGIKKPITKRRGKDELTNLACLLPQDRRYIDVSLAKGDTVVRIKDPKFIIKLSNGKEYQHSTKNIKANLLAAIARLYGDVGGIVFQKDLYQKWRTEKGIPSVNNFVLTNILHDIENLPSIQEFASVSVEKMKEFAEGKFHWSEVQEMDAIINRLLEQEATHYLIPGYKALQGDDIHRWELWKEIHKFCDSSTTYKLIEATQEHLKKIPLHKEAQDFLIKLNKNPLSEILGSPGFARAMRNTEETPAEREKLLKIVETILN